VQHWEALVGGLTIFAEAAQLLETLAGVQVGTETLRTHAEAAGTELEGEQRAAIAHVEATHEPPANYAPVPETEALVVEADGVLARYRDRHLDGTLIKVNGTRSSWAWWAAGRTVSWAVRATWRRARRPSALRHVWALKRRVVGHWTS